MEKKKIAGSTSSTPSESDSFEEILWFIEFFF